MILNRTLGYGYEHGYLQLRLKLSPKLSRDRHLPNESVVPIPE